MAVVEFHIMFDVAISGQTDVVLEAWFNEGDVINADDPDPANHYRLHTKLSYKPKGSCSPDVAFLLNHKGRRAAFYLEMERGDGHGGTGSRQLVERKAPGYVEVAERQIYLDHFRAAGIDGFHVLLVAPTGQRRDAIRRAFQQKDATVFRTDLWRFAANTDITPDTLLTKEMWYPCGPGPAEMLPAVGAGVRPGDSADLEKIELNRGWAAGFGGGRRPCWRDRRRRPRRRRVNRRGSRTRRGDAGVKVLVRLTRRRWIYVRSVPTHRRHGIPRRRTRDPLRSLRVAWDDLRGDRRVLHPFHLPRRRAGSPPVLCGAGAGSWVKKDKKKRKESDAFLARACEVGYEIVAALNNHGPEQRQAYRLAAWLFRNRNVGHMAVNREFKSAADFVDFSNPSNPVLLLPGLGVNQTERRWAGSEAPVRHAN